MLNEAKRDFASYKCPTASDLEGEYRHSSNKSRKNAQQLEDRTITDQDDAGQDDEAVGTEIIDPVHSI